MSRIVNLDSIERMLDSHRGNHLYIEKLLEEAIKIEEIGLTKLTDQNIADMHQRLAEAQAEFLVQQNPVKYEDLFNSIAKHGRSTGITPSKLLQFAFYPASDLTNGLAQQQRLVPGMRNGNVYSSSGTTNPENRKSIWYPDLTKYFIAVFNQLGWEEAIGKEITQQDYVLMLMPPETEISMPFASLVADMYRRAGAKVFWGAQFIETPKHYTNPVFEVDTVELNFKSNVKPSKLNGVIYNLKSRKKTRTVMGLLPNILTTLRSTNDKPFFIKVDPDIIGYGGGLKNLGIPPETQQGGETAVAKYLETIAMVNGFDPKHMFLLYKQSTISEPEGRRAAARLDEILTGYLVYEVQQLSDALLLNNFAGAETQPTMFAAGSLQNLYGEFFFKPNDEGNPNADVYITSPAIAFELRNLTTGMPISMTDTNTPGVFVYWLPFDPSHLRVVMTDDLFTWAKIPESAHFNPPYVKGYGLKFYRRASVGDGGYC